MLSLPDDDDELPACLLSAPSAASLSHHPISCSACSPSSPLRRSPQQPQGHAAHPFHHSEVALR